MLINTIEKAQITQGKEATTVKIIDVVANKVGVNGNKAPTMIMCYRCSRQGHYKSQCEMAPQQCPICNRDHVEATHKNFPVKKMTGDKVKTPANSELKPNKKKAAPKRLDLSGKSS